MIKADVEDPQAENGRGEGDVPHQEVGTNRVPSVQSQPRKSLSRYTHEDYTCIRGR